MEEGSFDIPIDRFHAFALEIFIAVSETIYLLGKWYLSRGNLDELIEAKDGWF